MTRLAALAVATTACWGGGAAKPVAPAPPPPAVRTAIPGELAAPVASARLTVDGRALWIDLAFDRQADETDADVVQNCASMVVHELTLHPGYDLTVQRPCATAALAPFPHARGVVLVEVGPIFLPNGNRPSRYKATRTLSERFATDADCDRARVTRTAHLRTSGAPAPPSMPTCHAE